MFPRITKEEGRGFLAALCIKKSSCEISYNTPFFALTLDGVFRPWLLSYPPPQFGVGCGLVPLPRIRTVVS